ncbi:uncharacterized protein DNG_06598 [Cephalotrichum gorgonifer]|uniref:Uncharacterized protein n=1 Tax=Cephalotrichum gorgonifer TaxID=2041049 RepID=A0AAE8SWK6_9PEZI|nr:uncharacterized protein DNG_06598 [Cephalotrichum gorgonifer]
MSYLASLESLPGFGFRAAISRQSDPVSRSAPVSDAKVKIMSHEEGLPSPP